MREEEWLCCICRDHTTGLNPGSTIDVSRQPFAGSGWPTLSGPKNVFEAIEPNSELLDVGCGGGQIAIAMAERFPSCSVTGVDLSAAQVRRALSRSKELEARTEFVEGSAVALPFPITASISCAAWPRSSTGLIEKRESQNAAVSCERMAFS